MAKVATTLVAVRVPNDLLRFVDRRGKRTDVIIEALERLFGEPEAAGETPPSNPFDIPGVFLGSQLGACITDPTGIHLPMCSYTEYDGQTGETYACGLRQHSGKIKHTRGAIVS